MSLISNPCNSFGKRNIAKKTIINKSVIYEGLITAYPYTDLRVVTNVDYISMC